MGFVIARREPLERAWATRPRWHSTFHDQWGVHGEDDTVALHAADARRGGVRRCLEQFVAEGGQPARLAATRGTARRWSRHGALGFRPFLDCCHPGADHRDLSRASGSALRVQGVYAKVRDRGFILYPASSPRWRHFAWAASGRSDPRRCSRRCTRSRTRSRTSHQRRRQARAGNSVRVIGTAPAGGGVAR